MDADRRLDVAEVVLESALDDVVLPAAAFRVPVPGITADAVQAEELHPLFQRGIVRGHHPAFAGGEVLRRIEAVDNGVTVPSGRWVAPSDWLSAILRANGVRRI